MIHTENSRVKIPAILHLIRLGYTYLPQEEQQHRQLETNIFPDLFFESLKRINGSQFSREESKRLLDELTLELDYDDLGEKFYKRLISTSGIKLIDFDNFENNTFHVTTEMTCKNGDEEFRPDITLLINGMPLAFIEVKKPHNKDGVLAERRRMNRRFKNKKFRRFANITQIMVFSNNMEYEEEVIEPVFGAFYATSAYHDLSFNFFREDWDFPVKQRLLPLNERDENKALQDNNLMVIKHNPEFRTNKDEKTPTNRILTSLFSRERLAFLLRYGFAYLRKENEKTGRPEVMRHIMRYPQMFATQAIAKTLDEGKRKGIIWHTQGSGKTALAYFNVKFLTDYFQKQNTIPKFYFVVDRLDLLIQASTEFANRGLKVKTVNSRADFVSEFQKRTTLHNDSGVPEITVVNIQKFTENTGITKKPDYDIHIQRIFFLDEAHRSYNPKGNYFANLISSDRKAVKIALTGTPLLREVAKNYSTKTLFGAYIHKYYYNRSIADGYTLRLIREEIKGSFKIQMQEVMRKIKILEGDVKAQDIYAHPSFVAPLLQYILDDLIQFRRDHQDQTLNGMVVCDSSKQAKELFKEFQKLNGEQETDSGILMAAEEQGTYEKKKLKAALILYDENDKEIRKGLTKAFKKGQVDILFVYNMLLTGFDAHRLKKLYLARVIQDHNLLQTLTRVNRPYKKNKYGYVVDFADISKAFDRTNQLYFNELQDQLGDEMENYNQLFKSEQEIEQEAEELKEALFHYDLANLENFSYQIAQIHDKKELIRIINALQMAKELKNTAIFNNYENLRELLDFEKLNRALIEARNRLNNLNLLESLDKGEETQNLLNTALEDILFQFVKVGEEELKLADEWREWLRKTRESLQDNFDPIDKEFVGLKEELERLFKKKNLTEIHQDEIVKNIVILKKIYDASKELNRKNELMRAKYKNDSKYARIHKRLMEKPMLNAKEIQIFKALNEIKTEIDGQLEGQKDLISNEAYFTRYLMGLLIRKFEDPGDIRLDKPSAVAINQIITNEYLREYHSF